MLPALLLAAAAAALSAADAQPIPSGFAAMECAFHGLAAEMAAALAPQAAHSDIVAALHLQDCPQQMQQLEKVWGSGALRGGGSWMKWLYGTAETITG